MAYDPSYGDAIASIESGGNYSAIGPRTGTGDQAYGKYQVMGANIPQWTKEHYGQELTPQQFLQTPEAQDAVIKGEFSKNLDKYGTPQDAASVWFSGRPLAKAGNASDGYNTVPQYIAKFNAALGQNGGQNVPNSVPAYNQPPQQSASLPAFSWSPGQQAAPQAQAPQSQPSQAPQFDPSALAQVQQAQAPQFQFAQARMGQVHPQLAALIQRLRG